MGKKLLLCIILCAFSGNIWAAEKIVFLSTQLAPSRETEVVRSQVLNRFSSPVSFLPVDERNLFFELVKKIDDSPELVGALHGEFVHLAKDGFFVPATNYLPPQQGKRINPKFTELAKVNGKQVFVPWLQATYLMVANKKALPYLPKKAKLNQLTYAQLLQWSRNLQDKTGQARLGFPAGEGGLMHRFLQGYLYPSFTGGTVRPFRSKDAEQMWAWFQKAWKSVSPHSVTYKGMAEPLLTGEVWVAWDHTARLAPALEQKPEEFVAFPAPIGPQGRGFLLVLAGLGIPKASKHKDAAADLIQHMISKETQKTLLVNTGFYPVVLDVGTNLIPVGLANIAEAVALQSTLPESKPALLPVGLGKYSKDFNTLFQIAFSRIVLRGRSPESVLPPLAKRMEDIISTTQVPCWPPDTPSSGPCPIHK